MNQPSFLISSLLVVLGGGIGAWLRFVAGRLIGQASFPYATLAVNIIGSMAMGLLMGWLARQGGDNNGWRLLLGVGLLGGFTTFSAFSLEIVTLAQRGAVGAAAAYAALSLAGGIIGLIAGLRIMA